MGTQLTEEDLAELAGRASNGSAAEELVCPECGKGPFASQAALNGHLAAHRGKQAASKQAGRAASSRTRQAPSSPGGKAVGLDGAAKTIVNKAVANTQTIGAFLAGTIAPHTGLAIAGFRDPQTKEVLVRSRAEIAGEIVLGHLAAAQSAEELQRAAQIVELLRRYNSLFEYTALGDVAGSLAVAGLVDARIIPPDFKIRMGQLELPIAAATIGDVVQELERQGLYDVPDGAPEYSGPGDNPLPRPPGESEEIPGGVEAT